MSVSRPLTGPEVKSCLLASLSQAAVEAGLTADSFARSATQWLDSQSFLGRENLTYPHISWEIEVTVETPRKEFGSRDTLDPWISAHFEIDLGNNQQLNHRLGRVAPLDRDCDTSIGKSWQEAVRFPDRLRARWLQGGVVSTPLEPSSPPAEAPGESKAPAEAPKNFVVIQDLPEADLLATPPSVPETDPEEIEPALPAPSRRRGRPRTQKES